MIEIDWGDVQPSLEERVAVESRVRPLIAMHHEQVSLRRRGSGYEAQVRTALPGRSTVLRLHGDTLGDVVDRAAELLTIVARESARQHGGALAAASCRILLGLGRGVGRRRAGFGRTAAPRGQSMMVGATSAPVR